MSNKKSSNKQMNSASQGAAGRSESSQAALGAGSDVATRGPDGPKRPPRILMGAGVNLHVPESLLDREAYAYRWFAENHVKGGRIESANGAYWEHVTIPGGGGNLTRPSGGDTFYLMKLEIEYWEADQLLKKRRVDATLLKESQIGDDEYAPTPGGRAEGGTSAITRETKDNPYS